MREQTLAERVRSVLFVAAIGTLTIMSRSGDFGFWTALAFSVAVLVGVGVVAWRARRRMSVPTEDRDQAAAMPPRRFREMPGRVKRSVVVTTACAALLTLMLLPAGVVALADDNSGGAIFAFVFVAVLDATSVFTWRAARRPSGWRLATERRSEETHRDAQVLLWFGWVPTLALAGIAYAAVGPTAPAVAAAFGVNVAGGALVVWVSTKREARARTVS